MSIIDFTNNSTENDKLKDFVLRHPHGNFFQAPSYYIFYKALPEYEPIAVVSTDDSGNIVGSLLGVIQKEKGYLKGKLSSRCIIYGGPIVSEDNKEITDLLLKELIKKAESTSIYIEFRNLFSLANNKDVFENNGFGYKSHYNFNLEILSSEANLKKLNKTRRWEINKSIKEGAQILEAIDVNEVKEFYLILKNLYKEKVKKPLPDFNFFEQFFYSPNLGKYFFIKYKGKIVGGAMCPIFNDTIYEWYECALDKEYKNLYPGTLATWAPIEYAAKNSLKYFDFLGAGSADRDYGVRAFKSKFGGVLVEYGRFIRINNKLLYNIGKLGLKIYSIFK